MEQEVPAVTSDDEEDAVFPSVTSPTLVHDSDDTELQQEAEETQLTYPATPLSMQGIMSLPSKVEQDCGTYSYIVS